MCFWTILQRFSIAFYLIFYVYIRHSASSEAYFSEATYRITDGNEPIAFEALGHYVLKLGRKLLKLIIDLDLLTNRLHLKLWGVNSRS